MISSQYFISLGSQRNHPVILWFQSEYLITLGRKGDLQKEHNFAVCGSVLF